MLLESLRSKNNIIRPVLILWVVLLSVQLVVAAPTVKGDELLSEEVPHVVHDVPHDALHDGLLRLDETSTSDPIAQKSERQGAEKMYEDEEEKKENDVTLKAFFSSHSRASGSRMLFKSSRLRRSSPSVSDDVASAKGSTHRPKAKIEGAMLVVAASIVVVLLYFCTALSCYQQLIQVLCMSPQSKSDDDDDDDTY